MMNKDKIIELAKELYKNEEVAIELANVIFGIRDGDYEESIPDKAIVRCWSDEYVYQEVIRFYDAINKCTFDYVGDRYGLIYDNYEIVENPSKRMLELQKTLED